VGEPSRRRRAAAGALALGLAGLALALALGEVALRATWRWSAPAGERPPAAPPPRDPAALAVSAGLPVYRTLRDLAQKGANGVFKGLPYRTNSAGFRGPELPLRPAPGVFRIAVGGDSVTMGSGVLEEEAYPARLAARLAARGDGRRYEVLNLGLAGLNTRRVIERIERIGLPFQPDLLVYGFTLNDIEGPDYVSTLDPQATLRKTLRYLRFADSSCYLLRAAWPRLLALYERAFEPPGSLDHDYRYNYFENEAAWRQVTDGLDRLARIARENGVCGLVFVHTRPEQLRRLLPFVDVMEHVAQAARERGLYTKQSHPHFQGREPDPLRISFADAHPSPAGHELLAEALYEGLLELPDACWR
jgi:lysophospholipase L1-like esterase